MSFEAARRVLQQYQQSNTQRITQSLDLAYKEALFTYQSEQKAREVALKVLENETSIFNTYIKEIQKSRREIIKGNRSLASKNAANARKNIIGQSNVERDNANAEIKRQDKIAKNKFNQGESNRRTRERGAYNNALLNAVGGQTSSLQQRAENYANEHVKVDNFSTGTLQKAIQEVATTIKEPTENEVHLKVKLDLLGEALNKSFGRENQVQSAYLKRTPTDLIPLKKAATGHYILSEINRMTGINISANELEQVQDYLYKDSDDNVRDTSKTGGLLKDVETITESNVKTEYDLQVQAYKDDPSKQGRGRGGGGPTIMARLAPDPTRLKEKKYTPLDMYEEQDPSRGRELRKLAQPVFDALRDRNTPYELTEAKRFWAGKEALQAYEALKEITIDNPMAVTRDEQLLLDDLALQRQLNIYRQKQSLGKMNPQMSSIERIRSRAADLAEPSRVKPVAPELSISQQKYFATERQALELSEKDDQAIRDMGVPEQAGLSIYQEMFDPNTKSFINGKSYDSVLSKLEQNFADSPEEQLRALTAFNSRPMRLSKASSALVLSNGEKNDYYLNALKVIGKPSTEK